MLSWSKMMERISSLEGCLHESDTCAGPELGSRPGPCSSDPVSCVRLVSGFGPWLGSLGSGCGGFDVADVDSGVAVCGGSGVGSGVPGVGSRVAGCGGSGVGSGGSGVGSGGAGVGSDVASSGEAGLTRVLHMNWKALLQGTELRPHLVTWFDPSNVPISAAQRTPVQVGSGSSVQRITCESWLLSSVHLNPLSGSLGTTHCFLSFLSPIQKVKFCSGDADLETSPRTSVTSCAVARVVRTPGEQCFRA